MGQMVIVCYRPKPGKNAELLALTREHLPILRSIGLVTDRPSLAMSAADGTVVESFEWKSQEAIDQAHQHPTVQAMWGRYNQICDYVPLADLPEAKQLFASFAPID